MTAQLPRAIQEELAQAEAIQRALNGEAPEGKTPEDAPAAPVEQSSAPVVETPAPAPVQDHKYDVLLGKYNAEVPRLHAQLRDQNTQLNWALEQLSALQKKATEVKEETTPIVSESDVEKFGDEMTTMVSRIATSVAERVATTVASRLATEMRNEIAPVRQSLEKVQQTSQLTEEQLFWGKVAEQVPDWTTVDADPRWVEFLNSRAPGLAETYREIASRAIGQRQAVLIAELVKQWKELTGIVPTPAAAAAQPSTAQQELAKQVAPSSQRGTAAPTAPRIWTMDEYNQAFDPRNRHNIGDKAWNDLMVAADSALAEGRVR